MTLGRVPLETLVKKRRLFDSITRRKTKSLEAAASRLCSVDNRARRTDKLDRHDSPAPCNVR